jgi:hypothetical protein
MSIRLSSLFGGILLISLSGCFEVIEEMNLNRDGSGHFTYTINASQSKVKLKSVMLMDSINGYRVPSPREIEQEMQKAKTQLSQQTGISGVEIRMDHASFIYSISASFTSVAHLNQALNLIAKNEMEQRSNVPQFIPFDNYAFDGQTFVRLEPKEDRSRNYYQAKAEDREVIDQAQAIGIFRFEQAVASASHPLARISPSGKAVMVKANVRDLLLKRTPLHNKITLE